VRQQVLFGGVKIEPLITRMGADGEKRAIGVFRTGLGSLFQVPCFSSPLSSNWSLSGGETAQGAVRAPRQALS
jgi:hypothetical protein